MSGEGSVDNQLLSEPKIEETCPLEDQSEQVPLSDTNFIREKSCSDFKQDDNNAHLSKEAKEPKKITEVHIRKNPNLKSSIPRLGNLASARTSSTTARPSNITSPHSLTSNRKLESSLKTLQPKPNVKERQSLIKSPSKLKPNSSQKPGSKSLTRPLNRSRPTSPMHDASPTRIYISEKKKFDNILNELVEKQGEIFKIHTKLTNLKDKVSLTHKDLLQIKDLRLVDLSELLYEKNLHMEGHAVSSFQNTSDGLLELEKRLHALPVATLKFCEDTLFQRESIIHWLRSVFDSDVHKTEEFSQDLSERIETYETEGLGLIENMQTLENHQRELIGGIAKDYSTLFSRAQKLQDDNVRLKKAQEHDTYTLEQQIDLLQKENIRLTEQVTETANTLDNEREQYKREIFNKTNMDRTIYNEKNRVNDLKNTIKSLELKVTQFETKYKELVMASKKKELSKADSDSVKKTRELQQYKEQVELMNQEIANQKEEHDKTVREFTERIYRLEVGKAEETELKEAAQAELKNKTHHLQNLQQQYASLSELVEANEAKNKTNDQDSHAYMVLKDQVEKLMEEVAVKDEQIVSLNAKMREFDRDMRDDGSTYSKSLCAKIRELEETVSSLKTQLEDADNTLRDTVKEKEVIETNLMKKSLELEQRDLILKEKTKIAELREELVTTLKSKEQNQEVCVQKLKAAIMVKESENEILAFDSETSKQTNTSFMDVASSTSGLLSEMSIRSKRAAELYTNLEQKHMELVELQRRVQELETRNDNSEKLRIRHEARINHLEQALGEKCLTQPGLIAVLVQ